MASDEIPEPVDQEEESKLPEATLAEFFESKPANVAFRITELTLRGTSSGTAQFSIPAIRLWCDSDDCDGIRTFDPVQDDRILHISESDKDSRDRFVTFFCRNCRRSTKKYAFCYLYNEGNTELIAVKLGEHPPLSVHLPSRLRKLVGSELEKFNNGLRSEAHGLGVGAFAYYRQVVENQKNRFIEEITKVVNLRNPPPNLIAELEEAKRETQFSSAVEKIKEGIPEILLINGQNPLILLHKALSEGLHAGTDAECLEIAQDIRVVLSELSERLQTALKDEQEVNNAVSRILNRPKKPK